MKKKIVTALLITAMAASVFTGCGNKMEGDGRVQAAMASTESGQDGTEESVPEATAEPTAEPTPEATAEPTGEPSSDEKAVSDVDADNESGETAGTTQAGEASQATGASQEAKGNEVSGYTFEEMKAATMYAKTSVNLRNLPSTDGEKVGRLSSSQEVKVTGQCIETGWYRIQMADESIVYASDSYIVAEKPQTQTANHGGSKTQTGDQTSQGNAGTQTAQTGTAGTSAQTSTEATLCNSEFIALLNADRAAAGLSQISVTSTLDSDALESAKAVAANYSHDSIVRTHGVNRENIGSGYGSAADVYTAWKNSPGHWTAMIDANLQYCSIARYGNVWVFVGYASNPVVENLTNGTTTVEQEVENGNLESVNTDEGTGVSVYGTPGDTHVATDEEVKDAQDQWGWDWLN